MDRRTLRLTLILGGFATAIFLLFLWQPDRQVRLHQRNLQRAVEKRDWPAVSALIDAQYADRWNHDKASAVEDAKQVFSQYLSCRIEGEDPMVSVIGDTGVVSARISVDGSGSPLVGYVQENVKSLTEPFRFKWVHRSSAPWDWALVEVDQPQLDLRALRSF